MAVPYGSFTQSLVTNPEQQRRSWYMFFFQLPVADTAVPLNDFAFIERLWQDWSPGWDLPAEELASVKGNPWPAGSADRRTALLPRHLQSARQCPEVHRAGVPTDLSADALHTRSR